MMLSTEQTRAVMHGLDNRLSWRGIERPVGPQPVPAWVKGAKINWHEGYCNSPSVCLIVDGDVGKWPDKRFTREDGRYYRARHEDGRLAQYAHDGAVALDTIPMFRSEDGTVRRDRRRGPQWFDQNDWPPGCTVWPPHGDEPGEWVPVERMCTTRQHGFGGGHVHLIMEDGSDLVLRGPWHVGAPAGYAEVSYDMRGERWGKRSGLYITLDLYTRIMARFQAHLELVEVTYGGCTTIEPMKPEWSEPKRLVYEREWLARKAEREARS